MKTDSEGSPSSPAKPGQGAEPTLPETDLPDLRDPGSNSHKPETRIGKLTYELRKTEIAAEIRKEELKAQIRLEEIREAGEDKDGERKVQLDKNRNRTLVALVIGVGVIVLTGVGYYFGKDADWTLPGLGGFKSHGTTETKSADPGEKPPSPKE